MSSRKLEVDYLARVEGEGKMYVNIEDDVVKEARLEIFEPPRFYEGFLRGRKYTEAPDITSRICGICPIAYITSSSQAMEQILGIEVEGRLRDLRRLIYCGEWIESHGLHAFMLHAPDFLGYQDSIQMAADHPEIVKKALKVKKIGNDIVSTMAGREIHPINTKVGGFYRAPKKEELEGLVEDLKWGLETCHEMLEWGATLDYPDLERDYEFVALRHPEEYAIDRGRIVSNKGIDIEADEFDEYFEEIQMEHSTSFYAKVKGRGYYLTGPLARYTLNFEQLSDSAKEAAINAGLGEECYNPFKSLPVRLVEMIYVYEEALRIIADYERPEKPTLDLKPKAGVGHGVSEAPRGLLYHSYKIDDEGTIEDATIVPPTAQNQGAIEEDLKDFVAARLEMEDDKLQWQCEQAIRNYDPCISCSCHFLNLTVDRD
ncbi:MAG: Ni/Fe hydrogenase subunit alpha [bacterium]